MDGTLTVRTPDVGVLGSTIDGVTAFSAASGVVQTVEGGVCGSIFAGAVTISKEYGLSGGFVFGQDPTDATCVGNTVKGTVSVLNNDVVVIFRGQHYHRRRHGQRERPRVDLLGNAIGGGLSCSGNAGLSGLGANNVHGHEAGQFKGF